jgi:hypothetical protein
VDAAGLAALVGGIEGSGIDPDLYTPASYGALATALTAAKQLVNAPTSQGDVDQAFAELSGALAGLVGAPGAAELAALGELVAALNDLSLDSEEYTPATWSPFATALAAARGVVDDADLAAAPAALSTLRTALNALTVRLHTEALQGALVAADGLAGSEELYTGESWRALDAAARAGRALGSTAAQDAVDAAAEAIWSAIAGLERRADRTRLAELVDAAQRIVDNPAGYAPGPLAHLAGVLADGQGLLDADIDELLQSAVDVAAEAIRTALAGVIDLSALAALVEGIDGSAIDPDLYTPASYGALATALAAARIRLGNPVSQALVDEAFEALSGALGALAAAPGAAELAALGELVAALSELSLRAEDFTVPTWTAFSQALARAGTVVDDADLAASPQALTVLRQAVDGLTLRLRTEALEGALAVADGLGADEALYTAATWGALSQVLQRARDLDATASQDQVDAIAEEVWSAITGLQRRAETSRLTEIVDTAQRVVANSSGYTPDSVSRLAAAIAAGETRVEADIDALVQADIDRAAEAVRNAVAGLKTKPAPTPSDTPTVSPPPTPDVPPTPDPTPSDTGAPVPDSVGEQARGAQTALRALVDVAATLRQADYTPESWAGAASAIEAARVVTADPTATADQVREVTSTLTAALTQLVPAAAVAGGVAVTSVKAAQKAVVLVKGTKVRIAAKAYTDAGANAKVTWKSSKKAVASVSASGTIKAKKAGKTVVTVSAGGKSVKIKVTVVAKKPAAKVTRVTAKVPRSLAVGRTASITGTYKSALAAKVKVTYKSSRLAVATIDAAGRLVAKSPGTTKITVKAGKKSKTYTLVVK